VTVAAAALVALASLVALALARGAVAGVRPSRSPFDAVLRRRREAPPAARELERLETAVVLSPSSARELHVRLRPVLRAVAAERLSRRGIELDRDRDRAQEALGPDLWAVVRPDRPLPARGDVPPTLRELAAIVDTLERL